jgi:type III pantothenate kinase
MDINLLVFAIGNSRLHAGAFVAGELKVVRHLPADVPEDWPAMITDIWKEFGDATAEITAASVVPTLNSALDKAVNDVLGQDIEWVGSDIDLPITVTTKEPRKTGIDRVLVTAAAYEQLKKACVVVDAGTAITVNFCNNEGALVGGAILPGVSTMIDALHDRTAQLPKITFETPTSDFGVDTTDAIRHGISGAVRGLVQNMAERWAEQMGTWPEVIATGGDAAALFADWEIVHAISPDLLMYGIALAYTEHQIKHGA